LDRTNLSFAAVQLSQDLGLSCANYGLGAGLFFLGYFTFQVPSNMILARVGAPMWLSITIIAWGLVAGSFAGLTGIAMFLSLRVALGVAECGTFPGMWLHLSKFYTPRELGPAYSSVATSTAIAQVIGAPLAAAILSLDGQLGLRGWQWLFLIEGGTTLIFGILLRLFLVPSPAKAKFLTPEERNWLQHRQDQQLTAHGDTTLASQAVALRHVLRDWRVWYLSASWFSITMAMYGCIYFIPMIIHNFFQGNSSPATENSSSDGVGFATSPPPPPRGGCGGGGESHSGPNDAAVALLSMIPFASAAIAMVINAKLAEAANERHRHAGVPICLGAVFLGLTPVMLRVVGPYPAFVCLVLAASFIWSFHGPFMSWPATFLKGAQAAIGFAWINSVGSLGGFLGPFILGLLADASGSYSLAMMVIAGVLFLGGISILLFPVGGGSADEISLEGVEAGGSAVKISEREPMLLGQTLSTHH